MWFKPLITPFPGPLRAPALTWSTFTSMHACTCMCMHVHGMHTSAHTHFLKQAGFARVLHNFAVSLPSPPIASWEFPLLSYLSTSRIPPPVCREQLTALHPILHSHRLVDRCPIPSAGTSYSFRIIGHLFQRSSFPT